MAMTTPRAASTPRTRKATTTPAASTPLTPTVNIPVTNVSADISADQAAANGTRAATAAKIALSVDAREFGRHVAQGGWRLGLLVARNVVPAPGRVALATLAPKTNATQFAKAAGTSTDRVLRYLGAWEKAAQAGLVPHAKDLRPGEESLTLNGAAFTLNAETMPSWSQFYRSTTEPRTPRPATAANPAPVTTTVPQQPAPTRTAQEREAERVAARTAADAQARAEDARIRAAGITYRSGATLPVSSQAPGGEARTHAEYSSDALYLIKAMRSYARRFYDIARETGWRTDDRGTSALDLRSLASELTMIADLVDDPDSGRATDAALAALINEGESENAE